MPIKVAINGLGRMGRLVMRQAWVDPEIEVVAINSRGDTKTYAHLLKHDTSYGLWSQDVSAPDEKTLQMNGTSVPFFREEDPSNCPWGDLDIDVVIESTGVFRSRKGSEKHLKAGAKMVVITAPAQDDDLTITAVNVDQFDAAKHKIVSAASCTSNALAPIVKILHDGLGIKHGYLVTTHAYTNDQSLVDAPHKSEDLRRARAAGESIIPTSTGAAKTIGKLIPELEGKLRGLAMRVPVILPSVLNLTVEVKKGTTPEEVNALFKQASEKQFKDVLGYSDLPLVSVDHRGSPFAGVFDSLLTDVVDETQVNVVAWYDNEWGFVSQMMRLIKQIASK